MMDKPKLLIIDDDVALCESLRDILELAGHLVDTSHTAEYGMNKIKEDFYNIILLDMRLPDSDGIAVLEKIKEVSPDTEVIIFTAYAEMDIVITAMDRNAFSFLPKPFEIPYLRTIIKRALEKQRITFENRMLYAQTLKEEREWEDTFDAISDLISIHDKDFNIIRCNKAVIKKLNTKYGDILGKKCYEVFHNRNEPWQACPLIRCKETLKVETEEKECMGGVFLISCFPRFDETGKFNGVVHIARDVTERKKAEGLVTSLGRILEDSLNEIYIFDSETLKFIQVNKGAIMNLGYSMKELLNFTPLDLKTEFNEEYFEKLIEPLRTHKKEIIVFETIHQRKDGSTYDVEVHLQLSTFQSRPAFVAIILDITEHKRAEETLHQQIQQLTTLNRLSQQVGSSLSLDQVVQTALDGIINAVNPDLTLLFLRDGDKLNLQGVGPVNSKYSHDETPVHRVGECLCGLAVSERMPIYSSDILNDQRCTWEECKKAGLRSFAALPLFSGNQIIGVLGVAFGALHDFENQTAFLQTLSNDISMGLQNSLLHIQVKRHSNELEAQVEERTKELNLANIQLKELDNLKSMFIASMSHELRTPLNSIIGFTGIILQGMAGEISDEQRKQLTMVKNSGSYLLSLINDIIDVSKIEAGKTEVYIRKLNLLSIVKNVINSFSVDAEEKGIKMDIEIPERITVESDERRIRQIFVNLVGNAVKFTDKGSVSVCARELSDSTIEIAVADTGIGIKEEDMCKLFKPFSQIPIEGVVKEGTGLGLYLCKKISERLGCEIKAESEFGKGSVFTVVLPLAGTRTDTDGNTD